MNSSELDKVFDQAAGTSYSTDTLKNDGKNLDEVFQSAHDSPSDAEQALLASQNPEDFSKLQSIGIAAEKGFTGGLTGVAAGLGAGLGALTGGGKFGPAYKEGLNERKALEDKAHEANPIASNIAEFGAAIPSLMVGGAALKSAGIAAPLAQGAVLGAGTGLTSYLGQNASPTASGAVTATGVGAGLGLAGGKLGEVVGKGVSSVLNPEDLQGYASKLAEESMGMNSAKGLTGKWNPVTQQVERGSNITKGIGTTALDEGILGPVGNTYDKALKAIQTNKDRLQPLLNNTQTKINPNLSDLLDQVGSITTKIPDVAQDLTNEISDTSQEPRLMKVLSKQYQVWEPQIAAADGNLQQLNSLKQQLTQKAEQVSPSVYNPNAPPPTTATKMEGELYQRLAGVIRQHIEDLANAADPGVGDQIHQVNKNIGNLYQMLPTLKAGQRISIPKTGKDVVQTVVGPVEKYAAKGLNAVSNAIQTPIGQIAQKTVITSPMATVTNPWSQEKAYNTVESDAGHITRILSNATNDSLKDVAGKFMQEPSLKFCGDMLNKAVDNDDPDAKNRAIFCAAQIPKARQLITPEGK